MPIVDTDSLTQQLTDILLNPSHKLYYAQMLARYNIDRGHWLDHRERLSKADPKAAANAADQNVHQFAAQAVSMAFGSNDAPKLLYPIKVQETVSEAAVSLYRAYDGVKSMTLGAWWSEGHLLREITAASPCRTSDGTLNHKQVLEFMLSSAFVHPYWNSGTDIAKMTIPAGSRIAVITGRGDWQAMKTAVPSEQRRLPKNPASSPRTPNTLKIDTEDDVITKLGLLPIPGTVQVFIPLYKDTWVAKVPHLSPHWPFA